MLAGAAVSVALPSPAQSVGERAAYSVAVVPQFPASELQRVWTPLLERVGRLSGLALNLALSHTVLRFELNLFVGSHDFAFMTPWQAVVAGRAQGYVPLLRDRSPLSSILVVRQDDPVASVRELEGLPVALPRPDAFGPSLWLRALLAEREGVRIVPRYEPTQAQVYQDVQQRRVAAGGGSMATLQQLDGRPALRVLLETPPTAPHPLAAHPRVPARVQQAFAEALLQLAIDDAGYALLKEAAMPSPVRADYARDYRPLENYRLEKYAALDRPA
jgi:phosphonate transport system substrate-binding protein